MFIKRVLPVLLSAVIMISVGGAAALAADTAAAPAAAEKTAAPVQKIVLTKPEKNDIQKACKQEFKQDKAKYKACFKDKSNTKLKEKEAAAAAPAPETKTESTLNK